MVVADDILHMSPAQVVEYRNRGPLLILGEFYEPLRPRVPTTEKCGCAHELARCQSDSDRQRTANEVLKERLQRFEELLRIYYQRNQLLERRNKELEEKLERLKADYDLMFEENERLEKQVKVVKDERDLISEENEWLEASLRRRIGPRFTTSWT
ncbi:hypothetical protein BDD12DRAFT_858693 [Trichophaea hybrida]|nr:hypothetical protein BDD12DRAFT_858693 [Trichophaea hybrida]